MTETQIAPETATGTLVDTETGETVATYRSPINTPEWAKIHKGWVLRYRSAYGRRTGRKLRWVPAQ